jgi:hypothetical protein
MPRAARRSLDGFCGHVINRGNGRRTVVRKPADFDAFVQALRHASENRPMRVLAAWTQSTAKTMGKMSPVLRSL